jgi:hypothetical protein
MSWVPGLYNVDSKSSVSLLKAEISGFQSRVLQQSAPAILEHNAPILENVPAIGDFLQRSSRAVGLNPSCVVAGVGQGVAAGVAQHVSVDREAEAGALRQLWGQQQKSGERQ